MASSSSLFNLKIFELNKPQTLIWRPNSLNPETLCFQQKQKQKQRKNVLRISASVSTQEELRTTPDDLVTSILSKVIGTDRGVLLPSEGHEAVAEVASQLQKYCVDKPVECPLIFGGAWTGSGVVAGVLIGVIENIRKDGASLYIRRNLASSVARNASAIVLMVERRMMSLIGLWNTLL